MWCLIDVTGKRLYFKPNKSITFGRKKADILLQNDKSISRLHASISIISEDIIPLDGPTSICKLKDLNSKYGTYILYGKERMQVTTNGYNLKHHDFIRFGVLQHIYTVVSVPIITVVSTLNVDDKSKLEHLMSEIDGLISDEWLSRCTHLTVSTATLTEKVTCAMAAALPIVTVAYWEQFKFAIDNNEEFPDPTDFVPIISEALVDKQKYLLSPNEKRRTIFQNLTFVHFSMTQYKIYEKIISMAGGKSLLYSKKHLTIEELCAPNIIVLQYPNYNETQSTQSILPEYDSISNALQANECKMISDSEIPLAILHCSVEKYCNPKYKFSKLLKRSQLKRRPSKILNLDTQDETSDLTILPRAVSNVRQKSGHANVKHSVPTTTIIPETCDDFGSQALALVLNKDYTEQSMEEPKSNKPRIIEETKDTFTDVETVGSCYEKDCTEQSMKKPKSNKSRIIEETKDTFTDVETVGSCYEKECTEQSMKKPKSNKPRIIEETKDTFTDVETVESCNEKDCTGQFMKKPKSNKPRIIEETKDTFTDVETVGSCYEKDYTEQSMEKPKSNKPRIIEETKDTFTDVETVGSCYEKDCTEQSTKKPKSNKPRIIEETKDTFTDVETVEESVEIIQPKENTICIPETNDSSYSNMSPKSNQCFTHNIENLKTRQNKNTQDIGHTKKLVVDKETLFHKKTKLNENEDFELQNTELNDNENHNKVVLQRKSNDLIEINDSEDKNVDQQMMNLSNKYNLQTTMNNNQDCSIIPETLEGTQESKRRCKYSSEDESDVECLLSTKKKICLKSSNIENTTKSQPSTSNSSIEEQNSSHTLLGYNSSFFRVNINYKNFKKVYNIAPTERIGIKKMYLWNYQK